MQEMSSNRRINKKIKFIVLGLAAIPSFAYGESSFDATLVHYADKSLCEEIQNFIFSSQEKTRSTDMLIQDKGWTKFRYSFSGHVVEYKDGEEAEYLNIDADNDGTLDTLIRGKSYLRGQGTDLIKVLPYKEMGSNSKVVVFEEPEWKGMARIGGHLLKNDYYEWANSKRKIYPPLKIGVFSLRKKTFFYLETDDGSGRVLIATLNGKDRSYDDRLEAVFLLKNTCLFYSGEQ